VAEASGNTDAKDFGFGIPQKQEAFFLKGSNSLDWGMKDRLSRIFNPQSGRTVMLAFDHGYFLGPTSGLERMDLSIVPLVPYTDVLMCTRGALRSIIPPDSRKAVCLRMSAGISVLKELSDEVIGVAIEDAVRLNVSAITTQAHVGGVHERETLDNLSRLINAGLAAGIPTLAVTAVGKELVRDARYLGLATRICAELGAHFVKTYYCEEGFEKVTASCPVPVVIAGGKKLPEDEALTMAYRAIQEGASGVDMGRNIFQSEHPIAMMQAIRAVVHDGLTDKQAYQQFQEVTQGAPKRAARARSK
jgi:3-hydroxy-5-phosphonooxypentane-2,4-dione thiolase